MVQHVTWQTGDILSEQQASDRLPVSGVKVQSVESRPQGGAVVHLKGDKSLTATRGVVVATDGPAAQKLLGTALDASPSKAEAAVGTCCLYFRSEPARLDTSSLHVLLHGMLRFFGF